MTAVEESHDNRGHIVPGYQSPGDINKAFEMIKRRIEDHDKSLLDIIRPGVWIDEIRHDPRYREMITLPESKETHTGKYRRNQDPEKT